MLVTSSLPSVATVEETGDPEFVKVGSVLPGRNVGYVPNGRDGIDKSYPESDFTTPG